MPALELDRSSSKCPLDRSSSRDHCRRLLLLILRVGSLEERGDAQNDETTGILFPPCSSYIFKCKWKGSWGSGPSAIHTVGHPLGPGKELPRQDGSRRG